MLITFSAHPSFMSSSTRLRSRREPKSPLLPRPRRELQPTIAARNQTLFPNVACCKQARCVVQLLQLQNGQDLRLQNFKLGGLKVGRLHVDVYSNGRLLIGCLLFCVCSNEAVRSSMVELGLQRGSEPSVISVILQAITNDYSSIKSQQSGERDQTFLSLSLSLFHSLSLSLTLFLSLSLPSS